jgi:hypothetical protein
LFLIFKKSKSIISSPPLTRFFRCFFRGIFYFRNMDFGDNYSWNPKYNSDADTRLTTQYILLQECLQRLISNKKQLKLYIETSIKTQLYECYSWNPNNHLHNFRKVHMNLEWKWHSRTRQMLKNSRKVQASDGHMFLHVSLLWTIVLRQWK